MRKKFIVLLAGVALMQSCSEEVYNNKAYVETSPLTGKKVAILPVEVEFTGKLPKGYSLEKKMLSEEADATAIQNAIYSEYLYKRNSRKKHQKVELINVDQVNSKLRSAGIDPRESWGMNPDSLGALVGADYVLKVKVKKDRIMSETASLGLGVATTVLNQILTKSDEPNTSINSGGRTYNIVFDATLTDVRTHTVISKMNHDGGASWKSSPESVIRDKSQKLVRKGVVIASN